MQTARRPAGPAAPDRTSRPGEITRRRCCERYGHQLAGRMTEPRGEPRGELRGATGRSHHPAHTAAPVCVITSAPHAPTLWRELMGRWLGD